MSKGFIIILQFIVLICFPVWAPHRQGCNFIHFLCLKRTCSQKLFIVWRYVAIQYINIFIDRWVYFILIHNGVCSTNIYFLGGLRTESSVNDGWPILLEAAHDQLDIPVVSAVDAGEICSWKSICFASCSLLIIVAFSCWSSNSWAALWFIMCLDQTNLLLTPKLETNQMSHTFNLTIGKALIPSYSRVADSTFWLRNQQCS